MTFLRKVTKISELPLEGKPIARRRAVPITRGSVKPSLRGASHTFPFLSNLGPAVKENQYCSHEGLPSALAVIISGRLFAFMPIVVPQFCRGLYCNKTPPEIRLPNTGKGSEVPKKAPLTTKAA